MISRACLAALVLVGALVCAPKSEASAEDEGGGSDPLRAAIQRHQDNVDMGTRVIGGKPTAFKRNPWQVGLLYAGDTNTLRAQFCGGVIIDQYWLLTAAHCVDKKTKPGLVHVFSGSDDLRDAHAVRIPVDQIIVHPNWCPKSHDSDIALVKTQRPIPGKPIPIARDIASPTDGASIWISGWGLVDKAHIKPSPVLEGASITVINWTTCNEPVSYDHSLTPAMFCAGIQDEYGGGGIDSCQGDSGGPASTGSVDDPRLVGVISWGIDCALKYKYGVYTKVAIFAPWIEKYVDLTKGQARR